MLQEGAAFGGGKETRVQWVGSEDQILATGVSTVKITICYIPFHSSTE